MTAETHELTSTTFRRDEQGFIVATLHNTEIVRFKQVFASSMFEIELFHGGYQTDLIKKRMNEIAQNFRFDFIVTGAKNRWKVKDVPKAPGKTRGVAVPDPKFSADGTCRFECNPLD